MADRAASDVEIGRIIFRSWEHGWLSGEREASSVASAKRLLPEALTAPIYEILRRWEIDLLRTSLPFRPYGLRIRPAGTNWIEFTDSEDIFVKYLRRAEKLSDICPGWDNILPNPRVKRGKYGDTIFAPQGDKPIDHGYSLDWRPATFPPGIGIDRLIGSFSPRYEEPPTFP